MVYFYARLRVKTRRYISVANSDACALAGTQLGNKSAVGTRPRVPRPYAKPGIVWPGTAPGLHQHQYCLSARRFVRQACAWLRRYVSVARSAVCAVTSTPPGNGASYPDSARTIPRRKNSCFTLKFNGRCLNMPRCATPPSANFRLLISLSLTWRSRALHGLV